MHVFENITVGYVLLGIIAFISMSYIGRVVLGILAEESQEVRNNLDYIYEDGDPCPRCKKGALTVITERTPTIQDPLNTNDNKCDPTAIFSWDRAQCSNCGFWDNHYYQQ